MNQMRWVYIDDQGSRHNVGILHGQDTGNLVIHCNEQIVQVDFEIQEDKSYGIMINGQLCHIKIFKDGDKYQYAFEIDESADTPLNRARHTLRRKHLWQSAAAFLGMFLLCFGLYYYFAKNDFRWQKQEALATTAVSINAKISEILDDQITIALDRSQLGPFADRFPASVHLDLSSEDHGELIYLPWKMSDRLVLDMSAKDVRFFELDSESNQDLLSSLRERVQDWMSQRYPNLQPERISCLIEKSTTDAGITGLAQTLQILNPRDGDHIARWHRSSYQKLAESCKVPQ